MAIDLKDIQENIQDGLQKNKEAILAEVKAGDAATIEKVNASIEELKTLSKKEAEEATKAVKSELDELALKVKAGETKNDKKTFRTALKSALSEGHESILKDIREGKSGRVIDIKDFNWDDFTNYEPFVTDYRGPIVNPYSSFHYRDIIPSGTTNAQSISYPKEGATTGGADTWEHAGDSAVSKPEIQPSFAPYTVKAQWIAGLIKGVPVDMLEDLPWLTSFLNNKALNELMKAEDMQIQEGSGVDPELDGFFTGTNATAYDGSETKIFAQIIDAAYRQVANSFYNANQAVISNADKVRILLNTESGAGFNLPQGSVSVVNGMLNFAGLNVVSNAYLATGQALIGDFSQSQFVIRSAPRLRFFEQNDTDAEKNQILIRVEERAALAIFSSLAFVKLTPST